MLKIIVKIWGPDDWEWLLLKNGKKISRSPNFYTRKHGAERGAERFKASIQLPNIPIEVEG